MKVSDHALHTQITVHQGTAHPCAVSIKQCVARDLIYEYDVHLVGRVGLHDMDGYFYASDVNDDEVLLLSCL